MPTLSDPKREAFAQMCARGIQTIEAYTRAGYKRNTGNATALKKRPDVASRIDELKDEIANGSHQELKDFIKDTGLSPSFIIRRMKEISEEAAKAGKYDIAARCVKDIGAELFGMFVERKHLTPEKTNVHPQANTTINIENLNQALEALGGPSKKIPQINGGIEYVDLTGEILPPTVVPSKQQRG